MDQYRPIYVRILVLLFVLRPCDFTERVNLTAVVGSSLTFSDPVKERGFFTFREKTIALVYNGAFEIEENLYRNRINRSSSGHITLSNLQKNDSGVYIIDSKKGNVFTKRYELKLYDPVSVPVVSCERNMSMDSLSLQCSVSQTEQTTVRWFKGEQPVDSSRSGLLTVQRQDYDDSQYRCVAQNPADTKNTTVDVATVCNINKTKSGEKTSGPNGTNYAYIIIPIVALIVFLVCLGVCIHKKCSKKETTQLQIQGSVLYAQINHDKRNGNQSMNTLNPSGSSARPDLTTVYDQIEMHRMTPTYANCGDIT